MSYPNHLTVQWHITDRCNFRCRHCYQAEFQNKGFDFPVLKQIADQVFDLHRQLKADQKHFPLHFTLTGGEPLTHADFAPLLCYLSDNPATAGIGVLSNGSLLDAKWVNCFRASKIRFVQLSVEGIEQTHDAIRGKNSFKQVIEASQLLNKANIRVIWSFTAHQQNFREFADVAQLAHRYKISRLWSDRMIPSAQDDELKTLTADETTEYIQLMSKARQQIHKKFRNRTEIALARALQFQAGHSTPYKCQAGGGLITIMPDGTLYPCRRMPIEVGNLTETPLVELYHAPLMQQLRDFEYPQACSACLYKNLCKGGLRCLAYTLTGSGFNRDPGCQALEF